MGRGLFLFGAVLIAGLLISACNSHTELPRNPDQLINDGGPIYAQNCAVCHQTVGTGKPGQVPKLAGNPIVTLEDPIPVITIVVYGKGKMPAFGDKLDSNQIAQVLSYIRNSWGNRAPAVDQRQIP